MSAAAGTVAVTERGQPRRLSPQVEAQLLRLQELGDRHALALLLEAIETMTERAG